MTTPHHLLRQLIRRSTHTSYHLKTYHRNLWAATSQTIAAIVCRQSNREHTSRDTARYIRSMNSSADNERTAGGGGGGGAGRGEADGAEQLNAAAAATVANTTLTGAGIAAVQVGVGGGGGQQSAPKHWRPDPELMSLLTDMGVSGVAAKKALYYTNNQSVEMAANWIFENPSQDLDTPLELELDVGGGGLNIPVQRVRGAATGADSGATQSGQQLVYKMVFIVNSSLEMGVGKVAAQVAHAALGMHQLLLQDQNQFGESLIRWSEFGETKIVLKGESTQHLIELEKQALVAGLPTYLVQDAGRTQVKAGSTTVLCLYGQCDRVDGVSGKLRLL